MQCWAFRQSPLLGGRWEKENFSFSPSLISEIKQKQKISKHLLSTYKMQIDKLLLNASNMSHYEKYGLISRNLGSIRDHVNFEFLI